MKRNMFTIGLAVLMLPLAVGHAAEKAEQVSVAEQAFQLRLAGKSVQAKEMLAEYLQEHSDDAVAQFEYSRTLGYLMDFETAEKHAIIAVESRPDDPRYHGWQGVCGSYLFIDQAHHKKNLDPAILARSISAFEKAVELKPDYYEARLALVSLYNNTEPKHGGDKKKARLHADLLMEMDVDYGLQAKMVIKSKKSADWKMKQYQSALVKEPDNAGLHAGIALLYARSNQLEDMQKHLDKAIELDAAQKKILLDVVFPFAMKKDYQTAKTLTQRYLQLATDEPAAMRAFGTFYLAKLQKMSGDPKADETLKKARQIDPNVWMTAKAPPAMLFEPLESEPSISILWEKEISQDGRSIKPYTVKIMNDNMIRIIGLSHIPKRKDPKLIEYKIDLNGNQSELNELQLMDQNDITITLPESGIKDTRLMNDNVILIRSQYKTHIFQELTVDSKGKVNTKEIPGLTRKSVSTHGACRNFDGDVFLCGTKGYIRKIHRDGNVAWDVNYQSGKGEDGTLDIAFSESDGLLTAFGMSFDPDTKFTSKNSSLWLAHLDSKGDFIRKTEFEGISNFGKNPAFCLSQTDHPLVFYDIESELKNYNVVVSKFSKDLKSKEWTTPLFKRKGVMVSQMSVIPFGDNLTLAAFLCLSQQGVNPHFYILNGNGEIVSHAVFENISCVGLVIDVSEDKIFLVNEDRKFDNDIPVNFMKLICFKINDMESRNSLP